MKIFRALEDALLPGPRNSYRPSLLSKHSLAFFLAAALVAEAYYVLGLFGVNPSEPFLAAAGVAAGSQAAMWVLGALAVILGSAITTTVVRYAHVQATDMLLPAGVILGIVALLWVLNAWYGVAYG